MQNKNDWFAQYPPLQLKEETQMAEQVEKRVLRRIAESSQPTESEVLPMKQKSKLRRIRPIINEIGQAPLIALTATATPKVQMDIQKNLGMLDASVFKSSFNRPNLFYEIRSKANATKDIIRYIKNHEGQSGIIYCLSRKKVEELAAATRQIEVK